MENDSKRLIENWFAAHDGDGEFWRCTRIVPYTLIRPATSRARIVFATKPSLVLLAIHECTDPEGIGLIGRCGLPSEPDLLWIRRMVGEHDLLFLGDLDPVDLMVFAWLRASLHPRHICHLGINDAFLSALEISSTGCLSLEFAPSERDSLGFLSEVFPDFIDKIGHKCAEMLQCRQKIELEGVVSVKGDVAAILQPAIGGN